MTIRYELRPEDIGALTHWYYTESEDGTRALRQRIQGLCAFIVVLCAVVGLLTRRYLFQTIEAAVMMALVVLIVPRIALRAARTQMVRMYQGQPGEIFGEKTIEINEEGVLVVSESATSLYKWKAIQRVVETPTHAFLMVGPLMGIIVPRAAMASDGYVAFVSEAKRLYAQAGAAREPQAIPAR